MLSNINPESENQTELCALTDEEIDAASGGTVNGDGPLFHAFIAGVIQGASSGGIFVFPVCSKF